MTSDVLILGFNRPAMLDSCIKNVLDAQPDRVFISIDGPRTGQAEDATKVAECHEVAHAARSRGRIELRLLDENLGCRDAVSAGVSWFLGKVGQGAIVEDDVRIGPEFLPFVSRLLNRYRNSPEVAMVSGFTPLDDEYLESERTYAFTLYGSVLGWATWADRWQHWHPKGPVSRPRPTHTTKLTDQRITFVHRIVQQGLFDSWAYPWELIRLDQEWLTCSPLQRLTTNVGFGVGATHTRHRATPLTIPDYVGPRPGENAPSEIVPDLVLQDQMVRRLDRFYSPKSRPIPRRLRWKMIEISRGGNPLRRID